jgi:stage II sporulation protein M
MEAPLLNLKEFLIKVWKSLESCVSRNRTILKVTALSFFIIILVSMVLAFYAFSVAPRLVEWFKSLVLSELADTGFPPPYTVDLYLFIFLNNAGHFWNPTKMFVWVPLLGSFFLGLELLLNGVIIGAVAVFVGISHGVLYPIVGLTPHGVFEIPAFVFQFASIIRWHVTAIEFIMAKIIGEKIEGVKFRRGVEDTLILAAVSVVLFMIAAYVETYITPYLLGM